MKKIVSLFLILSGLLIQAQNQRFFYDYKYIPDSTNKAEVLSEMMILDVTKSGSNYYSHEKFVSDSIMKAELEKQIQSGAGNININKGGNQGKIDFRVTKSYPDYKVFLYKSISTDQYKISEDQKPEWKIFPDKEKIGEYDAQKATTDFGGRKWIAWFATDIPINDGPYKFYGLPGLIVKVEDITGSHVMTLVGNKSFQPVEEKDLQLPNEIKTFGFGDKEIEITKKQYKKLWKDYVNDPAKNIREIMMKSSPEGKVTLKVKTQDGKEISDPNQIYRNIETRVKENLKKNNNPIEPDLLQ